MTLMRVSEAQARILSGVEPLPAETVSLYKAAQRVLAADLYARLTQPPFAASAMDGYAVRACDVEAVPVRLRVIGRSAAGHGFRGKAGPGEAVRIFTGAPLPDGCDSVVIQENTKAVDGNTVDILQSASKGLYVRPRGYDFDEGAALLRAGVKLGSRELMLAAAMNQPVLPVRRKPVVAVLANGDELVPPGTEPRPDQIISSIPAGMEAAIAAWGGEPKLLPIALDNRESLSALAAEAKDADVLLTIGGASVGEHDLVRGTLEEAGARFEVLKVAMRPGKPVMFGLKGAQRVLSVPGNPVSALICARIFLKPLIDCFLGVPASYGPQQRMPLAQPIGANGEREHYMRARFLEGGVAPIADQDSALMRAFADADCLLVREIHAPALPQGAPVPVLPLDF